MIDSRQKLKEALLIEAELYHKKWYYMFPLNMTEQQVLYKHAYYLRHAEYAYNTRKIIRFYYLLKLLRIQTRYGISIPLNTVSAGFHIQHLGSVIINENARIGTNLKVHPGVVIGASDGKAPTIGDNVYIGPGAKVFGDVTLADKISVGTNAVVNKSCTTEGALLVGIPAVEKE